MATILIQGKLNAHGASAGKLFKVKPKRQEVTGAAVGAGCHEVGVPGHVTAGFPALGVGPNPGGA